MIANDQGHSNAYSNGSLPDPEYLYKLAKRSTPTDQSDLGHSVISMLGLPMTDGQREMAADVLMHIVIEAERDVRRSLATRLSVDPKAPWIVVQFLARDHHFDVAESVLKYSDMLQDQDLLDIIEDRPAEYWRAIAAREKISRDVAEALVATKDIDTAEMVLNNPGAKISNHVLKRLANRARHVDRLRQPLIDRPELDERIAIGLYWYVTQKLRKEIIDRFDMDHQCLDKSLELLIQDRINSRHNNDRITQDMLILASRLKGVGKITSEFLVSVVRRRQYGFFIALLSELFDLDPAATKRIVQNNPDQFFMVASRLRSWVKDDLVSLIILTQDINREGMEYQTRDVSMVARRLDQLSMQQAEHRMAAWRRMAA